jgi:hypothetical protein
MYMKSHLCSRELYCTFLQVTARRYSAFSLSEVSPVALSHDAVSRWLTKTTCQPKDIWEAAKPNVLGVRGVIIGDETVLDKSRSEKVELVNWQYSGDEHDVIRGIGMLNLLWRNSKNSEVIPMDYRIYHPPEDGKTKNDHFREMLGLANKRGVNPEAIIADSWYSSLNNLKYIRDLGWTWVMGLRKNRSVNRKERLENLVIPEEGLRVHLRGYGWITVYRFVAKNGRTDYIGTNMDNPTREKVERFVRMRWSIEVYHRELKQTCGLERCQSHNGRAQRNHIGFSVLSWIRKAKQRNLYQLSLYQQQWDIIKGAISANLKKQLAYSYG